MSRGQKLASIAILAIVAYMAIKGVVFKYDLLADEDTRVIVRAEVINKEIKRELFSSADTGGFSYRPEFSGTGLEYSMSGAGDTSYEWVNIPHLTLKYTYDNGDVETVTRRGIFRDLYDKYEVGDIIEK